MAMDLKRRVGLRVRTVRRERGLTQEDVAAAIGKTVETVSNIERGQTLASLETLEALSSYLRIPMREFFDGDGRDPKDDPRRFELEVRAQQLLRAMPIADVEIAVAQVEILAAGRRRR